MTPTDLRQDIELKVVELIKQKLAEGSLTEERSKAIAQHVLETLTPGMQFEELYRTVGKLDNDFPELSSVVVPVMREYEDTVTKQAEDGVRKLIRQGQYDAAEKLAQKAINQDVNIVWHGKGSSTQSQPKH